MPIHVREVHVKVTVNNTSTSSGGNSTEGEDQRESTVAECVEQVLQILNDKNER